MRDKRSAMIRVIAAWGFLAACAILPAQLISPERMDPTDRALLDAPESRREFFCKLRTLPPSLGFDLRYRAGWEVRLRTSDMSPAGDRLRAVVRVKPEKDGATALHLQESYRLPLRATIPGKNLVTSGGYSLGAGRYHVDWVLRDSRNRACSEHWVVEVKHRDDLRLAMADGIVAPIYTGRGFRRPVPDSRPAAARIFSVKILANFSNTSARRATLNGQDMEAVASILRTIAREPGFARFSLVAFNMQEQRVIYQAQDASQLDFPALGRALGEVRPGVIDYSLLIDKNSATRFVTKLLSTHLAENEHAPDAVLLVGPKLFLDSKVPKEAIDVISESRVPVFYLNYVGSPNAMPWRDSLGDAVKAYGGKEFRITFPKDLGAALAEILRRLEAAKPPS